jgi:hypothetical protein
MLQGLNDLDFAAAVLTLGEMGFEGVNGFVGKFAVEVQNDMLLSGVAIHGAALQIRIKKTNFQIRGEFAPSI